MIPYISALLDHIIDSDFGNLGVAYILPMDKVNWQTQVPDTLLYCNKF